MLIAFGMSVVRCVGKNFNCVEWNFKKLYRGTLFLSFLSELSFYSLNPSFVFYCVLLKRRYCVINGSLHFLKHTRKNHCSSILFQRHGFFISRV